MELLLLESLEYISENDVEILKNFLTKVILGEKNELGLYFYGSGGNGKSTFLKKIIKFFENDNLCFYPEESYEKKLIVFQEYSNSDPNLESKIKQILSNDCFSYREIYITTKCSIIMIGNVELPESLKIRFNTINFNKVF